MYYFCSLSSFVFVSSLLLFYFISSLISLPMHTYRDIIGDISAVRHIPNIEQLKLTGCKRLIGDVACFLVPPPPALPPMFQKKRSHHFDSGHETALHYLGSKNDGDGIETLYISPSLSLTSHPSHLSYFTSLSLLLHTSLSLSTHLSLCTSLSLSLLLHILHIPYFIFARRGQCDDRSDWKSSPNVIGRSHGIGQGPPKRPIRLIR